MSSIGEHTCSTDIPVGIFGITVSVDVKEGFLVGDEDTWIVFVGRRMVGVCVLPFSFCALQAAAKMNMMTIQYNRNVFVTNLIKNTPQQSILITPI
jgi:hypothetical protein